MVELPELTSCLKRARTPQFLNLRICNCAFSTLVFFRQLCSAVHVGVRGWIAKSADILRDFSWWTYSVVIEMVGLSK